MNKLQEEMGKEVQELTLEEAFAQLDGLLLQLGDKDVSLNDSFEAYEKGTRLLKYCNEHLDQIEKKMMILNEEGGLDEF